MILNGAQILIKELIHHKVDEIFGYPGGMVINIYDELYKAKDKIKHYITAHEQHAVHAADGYYRATGKTGVVIATSGPGATNIVTGIATAFLDSVPLIAITGNVATDFIGRDSFQEVDIVGVTMPITKHNYIVKDIKELQRTIREAFVIANHGRPGPVLIDIPKDVQLNVTEYDEDIEFQFTKIVKKKPFDISKALNMLKESKRPFIYAGGGVIISGASEELLRFADRIDAPIGTSLMGLSAIPSDHEKNLGMAGMHGRFAASKALAECDLIIAIGARFSDRATGNKKVFIKNCKVLHIDIDSAEIGKNIPVNEYITGDIKEVLARICDYLPQLDNRDWLDHIKEMKGSPSNILEQSKNPLTPGKIIRTVSDYMSEDTVIATDVGQHQMWTAQYYKFRKPRTFLTSGGLGTMGYGLGAAIGASIGIGKKRTVLFTSDGCFHMNLIELATAVTNNLPVLIILLDNNALGMVRQWQTMFFGKRYSETTLDRKTDYVKVAEAFGATGFKAETPEELKEALNKAQGINAPCLIHCVIDNNENVLPMIPPNGTIQDIIIK
ncbi:MAG: biosynthetic-type acetolactate synthase large subunit [Christensenellales bacterium]|jgi:acetolactate synthase-1/2/3 large subunit